MKAYLDTQVAVMCPDCDRYMPVTRREEETPRDSFAVSCQNGQCVQFGKEYLYPRPTVELTPVAEGSGG